MYDKVESVSKEIGVIIRNQMETLELKSIVAKINNSLEGFNKRFEQAGKRFSDTENILKLYRLRSRKKKE